MVLLSIGLLLIICYLIYLEIIQLNNFYNLNKNIKRTIDKRMNEETNNVLISKTVPSQSNNILYK